MSGDGQKHLAPTRDPQAVVEDGLFVRGTVRGRRRREVGDAGRRATVVELEITTGDHVYPVSLFDPRPGDVPVMGSRVELRVDVQPYVTRRGTPAYRMALRRVVDDWDDASLLQPEAGRDARS